MVVYLQAMEKETADMLSGSRLMQEPDRASLLQGA